MQIVIHTPTLACYIYDFYSYQIHSVRLANRKSRIAAIFQDGHGQINVGPKLAEFIYLYVKIVVLNNAEISSECSRIPLGDYNV